MIGGAGGPGTTPSRPADSTEHRDPITACSGWTEFVLTDSGDVIRVHVFTFGHLVGVFNLSYYDPESFTFERLRWSLAVYCGIRRPRRRELHKLYLAVLAQIAASARGVE